MITLYSYPGLCGLADNNPFGLKVFAALRLAGLRFRHVHGVDTGAAPHGQLPYIDDDGVILGDSSAIIAHLVDRHGLAIDDGLTGEQRMQTFCIGRVLDDLYWPMSYSRWKDERYWPLFRQIMLDQHPELAEADMEAARAYNFERYRYQGIGRYPPEEAYRRGLDDLRLIAGMLGERPFLFGDEPGGADAAVYGFVANILYLPIDTPLRDFVQSQAAVERHCHAMHQRIQAA
jgi:glutathione S-transferase